MNTTTNRKVRATIDFRPVVRANGGDPTNWDGTVVIPTGAPVVDRHSGQVNPEYRCWIRVIRPEWRDRGECLLMTQGDQPGSRRYRYGTFTEVVEAAEKWAARRYYGQEVE